MSKKNGPKDRSPAVPADIKSTEDHPAGTAAALRAELDSLVGQLTDDDLGFLVRQAHTLIYNHEVDRYNEAIDHRAPPGGEEEPAYEAPPLALAKSSPGQNWYLTTKGVSLFLSPEELAAMLRIVLETEEPETSENLFRWLERERRDILGELGISKVSRARLQELGVLIRRRFAQGGASGKRHDT